MVTNTTSNLTTFNLLGMSGKHTSWERNFQKETERNSLYTFNNVLLIKRDLEVEWANLNQVVMIA